MSSGKIGVTMNIYGVVLPKGNYLSSYGRRINISKEAKKRFSWLDLKRTFIRALSAMSLYTFHPRENALTIREKPAIMMEAMVSISCCCVILFLDDFLPNNISSIFVIILRRARNRFKPLLRHHFCDFITIPLGMCLI